MNEADPTRAQIEARASIISHTIDPQLWKWQVTVVQFDGHNETQLDCQRIVGNVEWAVGPTLEQMKAALPRWRLTKPKRDSQGRVRSVNARETRPTA